MAVINVDDIYILDNTGKQVDDAVDYGLFNSNENLLDNAYFVGGGSQLGDGIFPINQRGQASYSAYTNSIDRWYAVNAMTIAADGITCGTIVQKLPQVATLDGKTLTFSALLADGTMLSGTAVFNSASDTHFYNDAGAGEYLLYNTYFSGFEVVTARKIAAVKLELGTVSTLANDVPPDFGEELRKCQRYFVRFSPKINSRAYIGTGSANNSNNMLIFVPTPVTLRTTPTVSFSMCNCYNWVVGGAIGLNAINLDSWSDNGVFVSCVPVDTSQAPQGQPYALRVASGGFFDISCEL